MVELEERIHKELKKLDQVNDSHNKLKAHTLVWVLAQMYDIRESKEVVKNG